MRKPLVEKKRRARINESLQELRLLIADADVRIAHTWLLLYVLLRLKMKVLFVSCTVLSVRVA